MKKLILMILLTVFSFSDSFAGNFHDLSAVTIKGDTLHFSEMKGKKLMIVNTASKCGYTYQYEELQELYEEFGGPNFEIIGFPCNQFGNQEPGSDEDIEDFCTENYGVTFTMMSKINVKEPDQHPVYAWLTKKELNGVLDQEVLWNFQKYFIDENGNYVGVAASNTSPLDPNIKAWLQTSDVEELNFYSNNLSVFPNPATSVINIEGLNAATAEVVIYNVLGLPVMEVRTTDGRIDISALPAGAYVVRSANKTAKFIKH
jgi:glutathione peroxidase